MILENYVFLDIEASGLERPESYPIQVGCARPTISLTSSSILIRPEPEWIHWSEASEQIHGFSRQTCIDEGVSAFEAARRLNEDLRGRRVFSDVPGWDGFWLERLYEAAGIDPEFALEEVLVAYSDAIRSLGDEAVGGIRRYSQCAEWAEKAYPHTHKADEDAVQHAAIMRALVDNVFRDDLRSRYDAEMERRFAGRV